MPQPCEAELPQGCPLIRRMAYADTQLSPATKATHLHNLSANLPAHGRLYQRTRQESTVIPQELQTLNTARPQLNPCHHEHTTRETTRNILSSTQADTSYPVTCCIAELSDRERGCCCSYPHSAPPPPPSLQLSTLLAPSPSIDPSSSTAAIRPSHLPRANFLPTPIAFLLHISIHPPSNTSATRIAPARTRPSPLARDSAPCLVKSTPP